MRRNIFFLSPVKKWGEHSSATENVINKRDTFLADAANLNIEILEEDLQFEIQQASGGNHTTLFAILKLTYSKR